MKVVYSVLALSNKFQVLATKEINSEDIFTLEKVHFLAILHKHVFIKDTLPQVDDEMVKDFNVVTSVTAVLANQIEQVSHNDSGGLGTNLLFMKTAALQPEKHWACSDHN